MNKLGHAAAIFGLYRNPSLRLLDYFGFVPRGKKQYVNLANGLRFAVRGRSSDFPIIDEIFIHRVYQRGLDRLKEGHIVVDIGAHCGVFALAAALRGVRVLCFEPLRENFELLLENVRINGYGCSVDARNVAVAGRPGEIDLYVVTSNTGGSTAFPSIHPEWLERGTVKEGVEKRRVPCITLRDIVEENRLTGFDLLKMDCEGAEFEIVEHSDEEDLKKTRSIIMEYHPNGNVRPTRRRLEQAGFDVEIVEDINILFAVNGRL